MPWRILKAAGLSLVLLLIAVGVMEAHAALVSSEPAAGTSVAASPTQVRLVFSEPIEPKLSQISLVGLDGRPMPLGVSGDPHDVHALIAPTPTLAAGAYRVVWRVISADGHAVGGSVVFAVAVPVPADSAGPPIPAGTDEEDAGPVIADAPVIPAVLRGAGIGALMALGGLLAFLALGGFVGAQRAHRLAVGLAIAAPILLAAHGYAWLVDTAPGHQLTGEWFQAVIGTSAGRVEMARVALAFLALWALWLARRPTLALVLAVAAIIVSGAVGHSAAIDPMFAIPAKMLHLLGVAVWMGGLLWIIVRERDDLRSFIQEAGRVSSIALWAVVVVALSGIAQVLMFLPWPPDVLAGPYGWIVLGKVAGLVVLLAFGGHHRFKVLPRLEQAGVAAAFQKSVAREVAVMCLVVMVGGFLAYVPPVDEDADMPAMAAHMHDAQ